MNGYSGRRAAKRQLSRRSVLQGIGLGVSALALGLSAKNKALAAEVAAAKKPAGIFWRESTMDVLTAIHTRRSYRSFTGAPVKPEDMQEILSAGMSAPSAKDARPWHFVMLETEKSLELIERSIPLMSYATKAGAAILVCLDTAKEPGAPMAYVSGAICCQNMWLALTGLGYGAVWINVFPEEPRMSAWKELAKLPAHILPFCLMIIGVPDVRLPAENRFNAQLVHKETW